MVSPMGCGWAGVTPRVPSVPSARVCPCPALGLWLMCGGLFGGASLRAGRKALHLLTKLLLSHCLHPSFPYPPPGRRAQQPLRADQPQPTGLHGSPRSFLGDVPVIPHLPAPSADRIHHGNPWAAHSHLQLLRLGAHGPHSAGAAAPGLHSASPASKDTRGHPQSCQTRGCWGVGPFFFLLLVGDGSMHRSPGSGSHTPLLGTG